MKSILFTILLCFAGTFVSSQIINQVGGTVKDKVNTKANEKTNQYNRSRSNKDQLAPTNENSISPTESPAPEGPSNDELQAPSDIPADSVRNLMYDFNTSFDFVVSADYIDPSVQQISLSKDAMLLTQFGVSTLIDYSKNIVFTLTENEKAAVWTAASNYENVQPFGTISRNDLGSISRDTVFNGAVCKKFTQVMTVETMTVVTNFTFSKDQNMIDALSQNTQSSFAPLVDEKEGVLVCIEINLISPEGIVRTSYQLKEFSRETKTVRISDYVR